MHVIGVKKKRMVLKFRFFLKGKISKSCKLVGAGRKVQRKDTLNKKEVNRYCPIVEASSSVTFELIV